MPCGLDTHCSAGRSILVQGAEGFRPVQTCLVFWGRKLDFPPPLMQQDSDLSHGTEAVMGKYPYQACLELDYMAWMVVCLAL